MVIDSSAEVYQ
jgi:hypothetical protein